MITGQKERQGDYVFTAKELGEYKFCFSNEMSTFADKMVDFEIAVYPHPSTGVSPSGSSAGTLESRPGLTL